MSFYNKVDYMPNQPLSDNSQHGSNIEHKKFQKRKWQILIGTFFLLVIISNGVIWMQPAIYQSQGILHFSYASQTEQEFGVLAQRHITLHAQRLKSSAVLARVSDALAQNQYLDVSSQFLFDNLEIEPNLTGRIITLKVNGADPELLKPILDTWVKVYLELISSEREIHNSEDQNTASEQLLLLDQKIIEQKQQVADFAKINNITSLERDENRVLNKVKNLSASLDLAIAEKAEKSAQQASVMNSIENGETLIRPDDKPGIDGIRVKLQEITTDLDALSEQYTQAYLERDAVIVARQQEAIKLKDLLAEQIKLSQATYLQDVQRNFQTATNKAAQLQELLDEQSKLAQSFNQNLEEFKQLDTELKSLQTQVQILKTQQTAQEVSKPFDAKISLLEPPLTPDFAIAPNYLLNSLISLIASAVIAILALFLFSFIFKQNSPQSRSDNYVVIPGQSFNQDHPNLGHQQHSQLTHSNPQALSQLATPQPQRLLSGDESRALFAVANNQAKALIGLIMCGVTQEELKTITHNDFQQDYSKINLTGELSRVLTLSPCLTDVLRSLVSRDINEKIWANLDPEQDFLPLLLNAAHDAKLPTPEQVDLKALRHTYLVYLVLQGIKLNDIESVAGFTSPLELAQYRHVSNPKNIADIADIDTQYPLI